jgi:hypothetical protein
MVTCRLLLGLASLLQAPGSYDDAGVELPPWNRGCNAPLLERSFAVDKGPDLPATPEAKARIQTVVDELKRGYGGTLVVSGPDDAIDSPPFVSAYLRAFAVPDEKDVQGYDYLFERLLARVAGAPAALDDARLDWDVWRAYLCYESFVAGTEHYNNYQLGNTIYGLDGAKDLLWIYLGRQAEQIRNDERRRAWWIQAATHGMKPAGNRPLRRWILLQLLSATDTETEKTVRPKPPADDPPRRRPGPYDVFMDARMEFDVLIEELSTKSHPPFADAIRLLAASQRLKYEAWGLPPFMMPATQAIKINLGYRWDYIPALVINQESWSKEPQGFGVSFWRTIGSRSYHANVYFPQTDVTEGVYFYTHNNRLYVWPKAQMDAAIIQLLHRQGWFDDTAYQAFRAQGYRPLATTLSGP